MRVALRVTFTMLGIGAIGRVLAIAAPSDWKLGELVLLAAFVVLLRECVRLRGAAQDLRRCNDPFAGTAECFGGSAGYAQGVGSEKFSAPDFEQAAPSPKAAPSEFKADASGEIRADYTVEQIANLMVTQAFRKVSLKHHPDQGGDPEIMRRVYAAREMMLRAIRQGRAFDR